MSSFLTVTDGIYDPRKRFAFTNITAEPFNSAWDGQPIGVQAGQTVELPHHLAVKLTGELVDKIMIGNAKMDEVAKSQPYYVSPRATSLGVPSARKVWEDQILVQIESQDNSTQAQIDLASIKAELKNNLDPNKQVLEAPLPSKVEEFADLTAKPVPPPAKKPLRAKIIKKS